MKKDIEQRNQAYKKALGQVMLKQFPDASIIVADVLLDPSMQHGKVWLRTGTEALELIKHKKGQISRLLQRYVKTRYMPSLEFVIDDRYLDHLDNLFGKIDQQNEN